MSGPTIPLIPDRRSGDARTHAARDALVAYLRLLAACIEDEADMLLEDGDRANRLLARFRNEILDMTLRDAPVEALLQRSRPGREHRSS